MFFQYIFFVKLQTQHKAIESDSFKKAPGMCSGNLFNFRIYLQPDKTISKGSDASDEIEKTDLLIYMHINVSTIKRLFSVTLLKCTNVYQQFV